MKKVIIILFFLGACTSLSKNFIKSGDFVVTGGMAGKKVWASDLVFTHKSWYQELTLVFDLKVARINSKSDFYNWFSGSEKQLISGCREFFVVLSYELDSKKIGRELMYGQFEKNGYKKVHIEEFAKNLRMHPNFNDVSLGLYKVAGLCNKDAKKGKIDIIFPGYSLEEIKL